MPRHPASGQEQQSPSRPPARRRQSQHSVLAKSVLMSSGLIPDKEENLANPQNQSHEGPKQFSLREPPERAPNGHLSSSSSTSAALADGFNVKPLSVKAMPFQKLTKNINGVGPAASDTPYPSAPTSPKM
jgi:hypothetical protein